MLELKFKQVEWASEFTKAGFAKIGQTFFGKMELEDGIVRFIGLSMKQQKKLADLARDSGGTVKKMDT